MTHICVSRTTIIGLDNSLSPDRRQAVIKTNAGVLLIGPLGTNFSEIFIEIYTFSFKKMRLKMYSAKMAASFAGLNVLYDSLTVLWWTIKTLLSVMFIVSFVLYLLISFNESNDNINWIPVSCVRTNFLDNCIVWWKHFRISQIYGWLDMHCTIKHSDVIVRETIHISYLHPTNQIWNTV